MTTCKRTVHDYCLRLYTFHYKQSSFTVEVFQIENLKIYFFKEETDLHIEVAATACSEIASQMIRSALCPEVPCLRPPARTPTAHLRALLRVTDRMPEGLEGGAGEVDPGFEAYTSVIWAGRVPPGTHFYSLWLNTISCLGFKVLSPSSSLPHTALASGQKSKSDRKPHRAKSLSSSFLELDFLSHDWMSL